MGASLGIAEHAAKVRDFPHHEMVSGGAGTSQYPMYKCTLACVRSSVTSIHQVGVPCWLLVFHW